MNPVSDGELAGTTGKAKRVEALKITLNGVEGYAVEYRVHQQTYGWSDWESTENGTDIADAAVAGVTGKSKRLEAVEIKLVKTAKDVEIESVSATGSKEITVNFNQAVDTTKATFAVKKGSIAINVASTTFAADKKSATLKLASNLTEGDYNVTVKGLTDEALTAALKVSNPKLAKIEFTSASAPLDRSDDTKVTVGYKAYNQYGEDTTSTVGLTCTASKGTATAAPANGLITITDSSKFTVGEKIALSVIDPSTGVFATTTLTVVAKAQVADIEIKSLYNKDSSAVLNTNATAGDFKLVISAKDQYGNEVPASYLAADTVLTVSNPSVANVKYSATNTTAPDYGTTPINGKNEITLPLAGTLTAGTSTISIISKTTGHMTSYTVTVAAISKVDTLTMSAPELAVAGEEIIIPFTAIDQYGNEITDAATLNSTDVIGSITATEGENPTFVQNYVTGKADLVFKAPSESTAKTVIITAVTGTSKLSQCSINLQPKAKPTVITGVSSDFITNLETGASVDLSSNQVTINDQYDREIALGSGYTIKVETSDSTIIGVSSEEITSAVNTTLTAGNKGPATITLTLMENGKAVQDSAFTFDSTVYEKSSIASYAIDDLASIPEECDENHYATLNVYGLTSSGAKVVIVKTDYTVTNNDEHVSIDENNKITSDGEHDWGAGETSRTVPIIVTVDANSGAVVLTKNLTVLNAKATATTVMLNTDAPEYASDGVIKTSKSTVGTLDDVKSVVNSAVKVVDQFGIDMSYDWTINGTVIVTNISNSHTLNTIADKDTFNVTVIIDNGKYLTFKVIVTD